MQKEKEKGKLTLISLTNNPSRRITNPQIQHLPTRHQLIQALHHLRHARREIPPMHIQQVDVIRLQFLQARLDAHAQRFRVVARVVYFLPGRVVHGVGEAGGEFCREDDLVAVFATGEPFADPALGFFVLVVVCSGWGVSAMFVCLLMGWC
jgi:hypothetical protein